MSGSGVPNESANHQREESEAARENILKMVLTSDARHRLTTVKMVKPEVARNIEEQLIRAASSGQLKHALTDEELKKILESYQQQKRDFNIKWV